MIKKITQILILIGLSMNITGCLVVKPKPDEIKLNNKEHITEKSLKLQFPEKNELSGEKIKFDINSLYSSKRDRSFMGMKFNFERDEFKGQISKLTKYKHDKIPNSQDNGGLRLEFKENKILFIYERGSWVGQSPYYTKSIFSVSYKQTSLNKVVFFYPQKYEYYPVVDLILNVEPLDSKKNIEADFLNVFNNLDKIVISLPQKYKFNGEVNTNYPEKSIYANFERQLGSYKKIHTSKSNKLTNLFKLELDNENYPLQVEVYPYKNGSKVVYSTTINYDINSNGKYTLNENIINNLHKKIKDIANN